MCQIQFILNTNNKNLGKNDERELEKLMCFGSLRNNDAFGFFNDNETYKQDGKFIPEKIKEIDINKSNFIVGHNRYTTTILPRPPIINISPLWSPFLNTPILSGFDKKPKKVVVDEIKEIQHHPFTIGDFILVHNGVIYNDDELREKYGVKSKIITDSFSIIYLIEKFFKESKQKSRLDKIKEAIQKCGEELQGWYSCFLYDKKGKKLIFFKQGAKFYTKRLEDKLIGSTRRDNLKYVYPKDYDNIVELEDNDIYLVDCNNGFNKIGQIINSEDDYKVFPKFKRLRRLMLVPFRFIFKRMKGGNKK